MRAAGFERRTLLLEFRHPAVRGSRGEAKGYASPAGHAALANHLSLRPDWAEPVMALIATGRTITILACREVHGAS